MGCFKMFVCFSFTIFFSGQTFSRETCEFEWDGDSVDCYAGIQTGQAVPIDSTKTISETEIGSYLLAKKECEGHGGRLRLEGVEKNHFRKTNCQKPSVRHKKYEWNGDEFDCHIGVDSAYIDSTKTISDTKIEAFTKAKQQCESRGGQMRIQNFENNKFTVIENQPTNSVKKAEPRAEH